jgi:enoyl-[acyl-carrier-protein] reductase (NADH)
MPRAGRPDEIAAVALCLDSEASGLMTGSLIVADAGYTIW